MIHLLKRIQIIQLENLNGAKEALIKLKNDGYTLEIYSHRANTEKGADEIKEWMEKYEIPYDSILECREANCYILY